MKLKDDTIKSGAAQPKTKKTSKVTAEAETKAKTKTKTAKKPKAEDKKEDKTENKTESAKKPKPKVLYDKDIREPLCFFLEETFGKSRIIEEKRMGNSRADMVMVLPKAVCGIEIKSDADTYARLSRQVKDYSRFFDYNYVVAGASHAHHISEHVPEDWGIITVDIENGEPDFYILRKARENPDANPALKLSILWRPELNRIQEKNGLKAYAYKSKAFVQNQILTAVPKELLDEQISEELFERDYDRIKEEIDAYRVSKGLKKRRNTKKRRRKYKAPKLKA